MQLRGWIEKASRGACDEQACAYLALNLFNDPNAIIPGVPTPTPQRGAVKMQKLGELQQEFFAPSDVGTKIGVSAPIVLQKFPWLVDVLAGALIASCAEPQT